MKLMRLSPLALLAAGALLTACEDIAVANDPDARADLRGNRSCIRAVRTETGASSVTANTTLPVVEVNQYIIDVKGQQSWVCYTDDDGTAKELVKLPPAPVPVAS